MRTNTHVQLSGKPRPLFLWACQIFLKYEPGRTAALLQSVYRWLMRCLRPGNVPTKTPILQPATVLRRNLSCYSKLKITGYINSSRQRKNLPSITKPWQIKRRIFIIVHILQWKVPQYPWHLWHLCSLIELLALNIHQRHWYLLICWQEDGRNVFAVCQTLSFALC